MRVNRNWVIDVILVRLPPAWAARVHHSVLPRHLDFGQPFNGQPKRQEIVRDLFERLDVSGVVETGTYGGRTTAYLRTLTSAPIASVEANARFHEVAKLHLRSSSGIRLDRGDSRAFLRALATDPEFPKRRVFFYLDAHWGDDLPLAEELLTISEHFEEWVVLIDDFQVPDDPGYGYDDYGAGKALTLAYLPPGLPDHETFFPLAASGDEALPRRGCVVLAAAGPAAAAVAEVPSLRRLTPASPT